MSEPIMAAFGFGCMLVLIALRMPVGLAMMVVGAVGYHQLAGMDVLLNWARATPWHLFANYTLTTIPLFILMGALMERGGLARDLFVMGGIERMAFYEAAKKSYAVVATGERRFYGCFILKKGVIAPEA